jgi:hypothetical protein
MRGIFVCAFLFLISAPFAIAETEVDEQYAQALSAWSNILQTYVDAQGRSDFTGLAEQPESLRLLVNFIESVSPESHPDLFTTREDVIAYHINAYNILAMYGVIDEGIPGGFNGFFKRTGFFKFRKVVIGGRKTSLSDYENDVIRPLAEPRVHFALNCMVRDCPRLPQHPFLAETLDQQLTAATEEFFNKEKNVRIDDANRVIYLSEIMDFYTEDFVPSGRARDLPSYVNRYREEPLPAGYRVKFIDYDWRINQRP